MFFLKEYNKVKDHIRTSRQQYGHQGATNGIFGISPAFICQSHDLDMCQAHYHLLRGPINTPFISMEGTFDSLTFQDTQEGSLEFCHVLS